MNKFFISLLIFRIQYINDLIRILLIVNGGVLKITAYLSKLNKTLIYQLDEKVEYEKRMNV